MLEQVLGLARRVYWQTEGARSDEPELARLFLGKTGALEHNAAGRLAFSAQQDIRFVGQQQALAEGREWVDPFAGTVSLPVQRPPSATESAILGTRRQRLLGLVGSLFVSLWFCAVWAAAGSLGAETVRVWIVWMAVCGVYWLVMAVLQIWWWWRGCKNFWRPVYIWPLIALGAFMLWLPSLILLAIFYPGEIPDTVIYLAWLGFLAAPLCIPRFRRWLINTLRPGPRVRREESRVG